MADTTNTPPNVSPVLGIPSPKLSAETKAQIEAMGAELTFWKGEIDKLASLGVDTSALQTRYDQMLKVRKLLLEKYG